MMPNVLGPRSGEPVIHTRAPTRLWKSAGGLPRGTRRLAVRRYSVFPSCSSTPSRAGCPSAEITVNSRTMIWPPGEGEPLSATSKPAIRRREGSSGPVSVRVPPRATRSCTCVTGAFPTTVIVPRSSVTPPSEGDDESGARGGGRLPDVSRRDPPLPERGGPLRGDSESDDIAVPGAFAVSLADAVTLLSASGGASASASRRSLLHAVTMATANVTPNVIRPGSRLTSCAPAPPPP